MRVVSSILLLGTLAGCHPPDSASQPTHRHLPPRVLIGVNGFDLAEASHPPARPPRSAPPRNRDLLACIRRIESGGNYATDTGNGHKGAYQFTDAAWEANFGSRTPAEVSPAEQDALARNYLLRRGLQPWPVPSRRCA